MIQYVILSKVKANSIFLIVYQHLVDILVINQSVLKILSFFNTPFDLRGSQDDLSDVLYQLLTFLPSIPAIHQKLYFFKFLQVKLFLLMLTFCKHLHQFLIHSLIVRVIGFQFCRGSLYLLIRRVFCSHSFIQLLISLWLFRLFNIALHCSFC